MQIITRLSAAGLTAGVVAIALTVPASASSIAAHRPHDKVPACAQLSHDMRYWWPRLLRAQPVADQDHELYPWQNAAAALYSLTGNPRAGKWLPGWAVEAGDAISVLGIRVGPPPEVSPADHAAAVVSLHQATSHMHFWCPASVPASWPTPK